jgi:hypothetical protein
VEKDKRFQERTKVLNRRQKPEKVRNREKEKKIPLCGKRQKYLAKVHFCWF